MTPWAKATFQCCECGGGFDVDWGKQSQPSLYARPAARQFVREGRSSSRPVSVLFGRDRPSSLDSQAAEPKVVVVLQLLGVIHDRGVSGKGIHVFLAELALVEVQEEQVRVILVETTGNQLPQRFGWRAGQGFGFRSPGRHVLARGAWGTVDSPDASVQQLNASQ